MRICVRLPEETLARALIELLRSAGHEANVWAHGTATCGLRIQAEPPEAGSTLSCGVLVLRRSPEPPLDPDPRAALERVLREGGTAIWGAPLDVRLLLDVLGGPAREAPAAAPAPDATPDLSDAPHPWLMLDAATGRTLAANVEARAALDLPLDPRGCLLAELPLSGALRVALAEESEGVRVGEVSGTARTAAWWTDARGRRVVCLLEAPAAQSAAARNRESLADLGQMAATLAHEIRNPVASLAGALDLLEHEEDPYDRDEILGMARDRLKQLARLLERTLSLARPITGTVERVEIGPVVASAVSTVTLDPAFRDVRMEIDAPEEEICVLALEGPLLQALTNLLINAAQAQEGVGLVRVEVGRDGRRALIRVRDEGPGIPLERRSEIFKPFYTTKPAGTGLGLAQVRRTMEALGGAVVIEDCERGACLRLELPLAPQA